MLPDWARSGRSKWEYHGQKRPKFAIEPKKGQESVWDYPRPPRLEADKREVLVIFSNTIIAQTTQAIRILETASPPSFYIPPTDLNINLLKKSTRTSRCEWKGQAVYWDVKVNDNVVKAGGWSYPDPFEEFIQIKNYLAFYPALVDCYVDGEHVKPQPGGFYGGWITQEIVGPVKGESNETYL